MEGRVVSVVSASSFTACGERHRYDPATSGCPMPRTCPQPEEQSLQGNLFGAPEPTHGATAPSTRASEALAADALAELSDANLSADAASRPRQRQASCDPEEASNPVDDLGSCMIYLGSLPECLCYIPWIGHPVQWISVDLHLSRHRILQNVQVDSAQCSETHQYRPCQ